MLAATRSRRRVVVIGGGLLGLEAASGLLQRGLHVTVVHIHPHLMEQQLDAQAADMLRGEASSGAACNSGWPPRRRTYAGKRA